MKKVVSVLLLAGMLLPALASADIVSLQPLQSASTPASPLSCFDFTRTLKMGSTLYDVRALQYALQKEGSTISTSEYGVFGTDTLAAVNAYQQKYAADILTNGNAPTGMVGLRTRAKLNSVYSCKVVTLAPATPINVSLVIRDVALDANGVTAVFCNQTPTSIPVFPARVRLNGIIRDFNIVGATAANSCDTDTIPYATWGLNYDANTSFNVVTALDPNGMYKQGSLTFPLSATTTLTLPAITGAHLSIRGIILKSNGLQGTFCNLGDADLTSYPVRVIMNGVSKDFDIPELYMHGKCTSKTWTYDNWNVSGVTGTLINATVNIDPNNVIKESNEFDNSASISGVL